MTEDTGKRNPPRVIVIADVESNAQSIIKRVLVPAGMQAWTETSKTPPCDVLIVDVTQLRGDPFAGLRSRRESGDETPAIVIASHFSPNRLRDLFRLNVGDILLKPYRPDDLIKAILDLTELRSVETNTKILAHKLDALREQFRRRSEEIRTLSEIGRSVVSLTDLDPILTRVVEAAAFMTDAEEANIYLAEPGTSDLVLRASKQAGEKDASLQRLRVYDTLVGQVYQTGEPLLHQPSLEGGTVKVQTGFLVQSLIEVPLRVGPKVVGVLGVYNRLASRAFTDHQLTLLTALADWAGVALEHASLLRKTRAAEGGTGPMGMAMAPQAMIDGLQKAAAGLDAALQASPGSIAEPQRQKLDEVRATLQHLGNLPVGVIGKDQADGLVDIQGLVREVIEAVQPEAKRSGMEIVSRPGAAFPHMALDGDRVSQVVDSLINAGIRRAGKGRVLVEVNRCQIRQGRSNEIAVPAGLRLVDGQWLAITVTDSSPGLSADTLWALSSQTPDPAAGQSGPGLSMGETRMIAQSMGGVLWQEQHPGATSITFALPAW
jgi:signal transduction histidine kinase/DNA-binding NarL/FixJ family response regulator